MAATDYDAPRGSAVEDAAGDVDSLDALAATRAEKQSPLADLDEDDTAEAVDLPGAEIAGEELTMAVVPKKADEFTCTACFLVQHRSRIAPGSPAASLICLDCT